MVEERRQVVDYANPLLGSKPRWGRASVMRAILNGGIVVVTLFLGDWWLFMRLTVTAGVMAVLAGAGIIYALVGLRRKEHPAAAIAGLAMNGVWLLLAGWMLRGLLRQVYEAYRYHGGIIPFSYMGR